jgi:hypothetical protein
LWLRAAASPNLPPSSSANADDPVLRGPSTGRCLTHRWGRIARMADPFGHGICFIEFLGRGYDEIAGE